MSPQANLMFNSQPFFLNSENVSFPAVYICLYINTAVSIGKSMTDAVYWLMNYRLMNGFSLLINRLL